MPSTPKYERQTFAVIAVDVAVFTILEGKLHVLLIQTNKPELRGLWALPGGLIRHDEGLEAAVERNLKDKANLSGVLYDQLATFGDPQRDPFGRVVSVAYLALVDAERLQLRTSAEYSGIRWFPVHRLPGLAYDHTLVVRRAVERLKAKVQYTNLARGILPRYFTLTQLQRVYEVILGQALDKRNFRKKVLETKLVVATGKAEAGRRNRPAALYTFARRELAVLPTIVYA